MNDVTPAWGDVLLWETSNTIVDLRSGHWGEDAGPIAMLISAHLPDLVSAKRAAARGYTAAVASALEAADGRGQRCLPEDTAFAPAVFPTAPSVPTDRRAWRVPRLPARLRHPGRDVAGSTERCEHP